MYTNPTVLPVFTKFGTRNLQGELTMGIVLHLLLKAKRIKITEDTKVS